jgi:hypothetical protein
VWGGEAGPTMAAYKLVSAINGLLEVMGKTSIRLSMNCNYNKSGTRTGNT